jgi:hypothetical protein
VIYVTAGRDGSPTKKGLKSGRFDQSSQENRPAGQFGDKDVLVRSVRSISNSSEAVEGRDPQSGGEIAIGPSTDRGLIQFPS